MTLTQENIGKPGPSGTRSWSSKDAILYAIGVGAGSADPFTELEYTTENSDGHKQEVLPSFSVVLAVHPDVNVLNSIGKFDLRTLMHGEQGFTVHRPIPVEGSVTVTSKVDGIYDKGSGALVVTEAEGVDAQTGELLFTTYSTYFLRGEQGFGKQPKPEVEWTLPDVEPDFEVTQKIRMDQPLLYRLSGDRNRLHSDPVFAAQAGFDRPILHGLATQGFAFRALARGAAGGDAQRVGSMFVRFARPVLPGTSLTTRGWIDGHRIVFQTLNAEGAVVLDQGTAELKDLNR